MTMSARQSAFVSTGAAMFGVSLATLVVSVAELDWPLTFDSAFISRNTFDACVEDFAAGVAQPAKGMAKTNKNIAALVTSSVCIRRRVGQNTLSCQKNLQARKKTPVILGPINTTDAAKAAAEDVGPLANDLPKKHLLLVSDGAFADEEELRHLLSRQWVVHTFNNVLRAREALLIGIRPEVMVINLATAHDAMLGLIERIRRSADPKISALEVVAFQCPNGPIKDGAIRFGVSAFPDNIDGLLSVLETSSRKEEFSEPAQFEPFVLKAVSHGPIAHQPLAPELSPKETVALDTKLEESVLDWVRDQAGRRSGLSDNEGQERSIASAGLLLHGKLYFHQISPLKSATKSDLSTRTPPPPRPLRLALLKQQLRSGDDLMADNNGHFWLSLQTDNELKAIRVALRLAVALTRSSDPRHFVVGVALSGAYLGDDAAMAMQICRDTLPAIEPSGQLAVAVDRWKFSMPLLVAQALV
jgi:hypothetical protein